MVLPTYNIHAKLQRMLYVARLHQLCGSTESSLHMQSWNHRIVVGSSNVEPQNCALGGSKAAIYSQTWRPWAAFWAEITTINRLARRVGGSSPRSAGGGLVIIRSICDRLMWASRKPGVGRGSGTPGDSHLVGLARGRPGVGAHFARAVPGVDPHCPGRGDSLLSLFLMCFAPSS